MDEERVDALARAIAGSGLAAGGEPESVVVSDDSWRPLLGRVRSERITGLAIESVESGWLALTDAQIASLLDAHRDAMSWCLSVERKLVRLAEDFDREGVSFAVLKGASVAHTAYPDPSLRSFGDLDLLVGTGDYERACALLADAGHARRQPEPRPGFDARFGRASVHKHADDGIEVDLHRTPGWGPFGLWLDPEELLDRMKTFPLGGRPIGRLDNTGMLLNVAMHASLGGWPPRLVPLRDVLQISAGPDVDWDTLFRWAESWGLTGVLQHAFAAAGQTLNAPIPRQASPLLEARPARAEARLLANYTTARRSEGATSLTAFRAISGLRGKAVYAWALTFPSRRFLEARSATGGAASYLRRWSVPFRWARARIALRSATDPATRTKR